MSSSKRTLVDCRQFSWIRRFALDYTYDFSNVSAYFTGDPMSSEAWHTRITGQTNHGRDTDTIADILETQQQQRGAPPAALAATQRLRKPNSVAIVTGQQAGLFGGPLFTLLKAITVLQLAEQMAEAHKVPIVPIFWIDSEDHDWEEVGSCNVLNTELKQTSITLIPPPGAGTNPVASLRIGPDVKEVISELKDSLTPTEFTDELIGQLQDTYVEGRGVADAFGRWLESFLGKRGLVVFDGSDSSAKHLVAGVFEKEVRAKGHTAALAATAGSQLAACGYHAQVKPQPDSVNLFRIDSTRQVIRRNDDGFIVGKHLYSTDELVSELLAHPERFSPNVLLRPLVQDTLFPTVCYVSGPNELSYFGQLREVYKYFGVPMPLIYPRASATIIDSATARFLSRTNLPMETLQPQDEAALNHFLEAQLPSAVEQSMQSVGSSLQENMKDLIAAVPTVDPTLTAATQSTLKRMERDLHNLHNKILNATKRKNETLRRQFLRAQAQLFPHGDPQERAVGFVYFLNLYGPTFIDLLVNELSMAPKQHSVLRP